ncbi:hypothetical protein MPH_13929 [Macrophomina phaseolina MS6]|uniref:Rhodopsin domain-containing protein n=1 Tax=Macrophomina phaseolina (strain MS6) TaxID=1126212 RepID=K2RXH3_MACPH|nr:hypothetical protein MPH_13929 [Macrophomina phaseolina MS6]
MAYVSILSYNTSLCLTKFAIVFFCQRLFAPSSWRKVYFVVLVFISIYMLWVIATSIVPCVPVKMYWDKSVQGECLPDGVLWFLNAGLNIVSDFLVVLLPIPGIFALQLPRKQKIGVSLTFALGLFVCIISIVRLRALYKGATATDFTYDNFDIALWTCIEVNGAIVGACLPTLKPLIIKFWPGFHSSDRSRLGPGYTFSTSRSKKNTVRLQDIATENRNVGSVEEILGNDGIALNVLEEGKRMGLRVQECTDDEDAGSRNDTITVEELRRPRSSDGWSGRSSQRPVYMIGRIGATEGAQAC